MSSKPKVTASLNGSSYLASSITRSMTDNGHAAPCSNGSNGTKSPNDETTDDFIFNGGYYISQSGARKLRAFQYSGMDLSLLYKHVLSPLAQHIVDHYTPRTLAPNSITLIGLSWMIVSYGLIWFYDGDAVPWWALAFNGAAMLIYQTLDNMDGKQARRTNSSSPMGCLFDHGCDSINVIFGIGGWHAALGLGSGDLRLRLATSIVPMIPFYFTAWEQSFTHSLVLPIINGPSEGLVLGAALSFSSAFWGVEFWHKTTGWDALAKLMPSVSSVEYLFHIIKEDVSVIRNCDLLVMVALLLALREAIEKLYSVSRRFGLRTIVNTAPLIILCLGMCGVYFVAPFLLQRYPRTSLHVMGGMFVDMVVSLITDELTHMQFNWFRSFVLGLGVVLILALAPSCSDDFLERVWCGYNVLIWTYLGIKARIVIHEMCCILHIWCFDIVTPYSADTVCDPEKKKKH
eukprot:CAMPEP_0194374400 /NCGR_PEP_ID=MMETSP0174-20130528/22819_1 /TAXON_ID=216777 /ORGANISM="Proboscia alata, Strain PI-D3" /LENGTH=458 /DNA_ID=CAMNT_0039153953 /DNA_START=123 /DNA_END=1499 /DNA_ORIENTATION=-